MARFVLVPGAGGAAQFWTPLADELRSRGHSADAVGVSPPDPGFDLNDCAALVDEVIGDGADVLVAQSVGGFVVPLITGPLKAIVLLNAMIPLPDEPIADWWDNTGSVAAREQADRDAGRPTDFDMEQHFFHDMPPAARDLLQSEPEAAWPTDAAWDQPCPFTSWPNSPTRVLVGSDDRFFPAGFQHRVAAERLGIDAQEVPGGHLAAMSHPAALADALL